jgi:hypothetical protein
MIKAYKKHRVLKAKLKIITSSCIIVKYSCVTPNLKQIHFYNKFLTYFEFLVPINKKFINKYIQKK